MPLPVGRQRLLQPAVVAWVAWEGQVPPQVEPEPVAYFLPLDDGRESSLQDKVAEDTETFQLLLQSAWTLQTDWVAEDTARLERRLPPVVFLAEEDPQGEGGLPEAHHRACPSEVAVPCFEFLVLPCQCRVAIPVRHWQELLGFLVAIEWATKIDEYY